ncbi:hypothetical protein C8J57DRAFT_1312175 [Mycena rebaudengoi]|nr:hypothetical protein C8J57DRAFT_1312175 [Mycena rebaudengoi]
MSLRLCPCLVRLCKAFVPDHCDGESYSIYHLLPLCQCFCGVHEHADSETPNPSQLSPCIHPVVVVTTTVNVDAPDGLLFLEYVLGHYPCRY